MKINSGEMDKESEESESESVLAKKDEKNLDMLNLYVRELREPKYKEVASKTQ